MKIILPAPHASPLPSCCSVEARPHWVDRHRANNASIATTKTVAHAKPTRAILPS
jgi:hypothetical protein